MEVLISDTKLRRLGSVEEIDLLNGSVYLWVIHANKIPPHIGISRGNAFFSLKANGKDEALPLRRIGAVLNAKRIATLFYEIPPRALREDIVATFQKYDKTHAHQTTCLQPLKEIFHAPDVTKVVELLELLSQRGEILACAGWQLPQDFNGIPEYDAEAIHARLKSLENG